jgi:hypothetical protein
VTEVVPAPEVAVCPVYIPTLMIDEKPRHIPANLLSKFLGLQRPPNQREAKGPHFKR